MGFSALLILAGLALLYVGAEGLVRGGAALALRTGLTPLVVGLTVVAFGTSSPELVVSIQAALSGSGDMAVGNVVGSNVGNIALILGLSVLLRPVAVQAQVVRLDVPVMLAASAALCLFMLDGTVGRAEGLALLAGVVAYTVFNVRKARREQAAVQSIDPDAMLGVPAASGGSWVRDVLFVVGGLVLLVFGADLLVEGAVVVARHFGLSDAVIGLTVVAIGTSMPELATSIVAAVKGEGDMAVGNVVGSNVFNLLGILGTAALVEPLQAPGIAWVDLGLMTGTAVLLLPLMRSGFRLVRWEGAVLVAVYVAYIYYLLP